MGVALSLRDTMEKPLRKLENRDQVVDVVVLLYCISLLSADEHVLLTSTHHPILSPPMKSAMIMEISLSISHMCVTPACPKSCAENTSCCQNKPRHSALKKM